MFWHVSDQFFTTIGVTLVLPAIKDTIKVCFGDESEKEIEKISCSANMVTRRINELSQWIENQHIQRVYRRTFFLYNWMNLLMYKVCVNYLYLRFIYGTLNLIKICCCVNQSVEVLVMKFLRRLILMPKQKVLIGINVWEYVQTTLRLCVVETVVW